MRTDTPKTIRLEEYSQPSYWIDTVDLAFELGEEFTTVRTRLALRANSSVRRPGALVLAGEHIELQSIAIDGTPLANDAYSVDETSLTLVDPPAAFSLETVATCRPQDNTALEGLYKSSGNFCTQCEAEGFRRITYFLDRPDVMAVYTVRIEAEAKRYPVLLSNGNLVEEGELEGGRHFAVWRDPFPKPCYLFALVAGDLACVADSFTTRSGRTVDLRMYVEHGNEDRCDYAMDSLKRAMRWDEEVFGLEYDLDMFNIVAVGDFNMGAMENKSLNVFNTKYVLAKPETATDADYAGIESVIAHEYFHNWTGNRVTCRDWFQLSLKEGLTVFRDQQFSADMRSAAATRINDVRALRARQFPEDAGPLAHPVRPESYIEINNFYTATVYEKGSEVIRMMHTLLGAEGFRRGMDLYFERHDGYAVTCEDFVRAMEDANAADLGQFRLWYSQAGTPEIAYEGAYDAAKKTYTLALRQSCPPTPGQSEKKPLHIPVVTGLVGRSGEALPLRLEGENAAANAHSRVLELRTEKQSFTFVDVEEEPVPSILRGFSAPVRVRSGPSDADRAFLMGADPDPFNRWEAGFQYATSLLLRMVGDIQAGTQPQADPRFIESLGNTLTDETLDDEFRAEVLSLPTEGYVADQMDCVDVEAIHAARTMLRKAVAEALAEPLARLYAALAIREPYSPEPQQAGRRMLRSIALGYLSELESPDALNRTVRHFETADNMTDSLAALQVLNNLDDPSRTRALDAFYARWKDDPLVVDKWLSLQAMSQLPGTLEAVVELTAHPAFSIRNPNKVRALVGAFAGANPLRFHAADGEGYRFLADKVLELDSLNPQVAARMVTPLGRWRRFDAERQAKMKGELQRILANPKLSRDVYEVASKSLQE